MGEITDKTVDALDKVYGKGVVRKFDDATVSNDVSFMHSGSLKLDEALGGGIPRGRIIELFGTEASGKTSLAIHAMANAQSFGKALLVDFEHAFDPKYARNLGLDLDELYLSQPDYAEQGIDVIENMTKTGEFSLIVIDSVAAMSPKAEIDGDPGDSMMGIHARLMSQHLRKIAGVASKTLTTIMYINQLRSKIGVVYGNPEVTTGGNALKYYSSVRLDMRRQETYKDPATKLALGIKTRVRAVKNKVYIPFREAEIDIFFGKGFDMIGEIADMAVARNIITKSGAWFKRGDETIAQGRTALIQLLKDDSNFYNTIRGELNA